MAKCCLHLIVPTRLITVDVHRDHPAVGVFVQVSASQRYFPLSFHPVLFGRQSPRTACTQRVRCYAPPRSERSNRINYLKLFYMGVLLFLPTSLFIHLCQYGLMNSNFIICIAIQYYLILSLTQFHVWPLDTLYIFENFLIFKSHAHFVYFLLWSQNQPFSQEFLNPFISNWYQKVKSNQKIKFDGILSSKGSLDFKCSQQQSKKYICVYDNIYVYICLYKYTHVHIFVNIYICKHLHQ